MSCQFRLCVCALCPSWVLSRGLVNIFNNLAHHFCFSTVPHLYHAMPKKALLSALSRRAQASDSHPAASSSSVSATAKPIKAANAFATQSRRPTYDDKSGPTPPRGSLTREKLSYLDWRLQRINALRTTSERTNHPWIDGRSTIGRNSVDVRQAVPSASTGPTAATSDTIAPAAVSAPAAPATANVTIGFYADEKDTAKKALNQAMASDSIVASMPRLAKQDSVSDSDHSGSSDQHHAPAARNHKTELSNSQDGRSDKVSFLRRASRRLSKRFPEQRDLQAIASNKSGHTATQSRFSSASSHSQRTASPLTRVLHRSIPA